VSGAPIESLAVSPVQDRALAALTEGQVDRAGHPWDQGNDRRLVALADDAQRSVAAIESQILGIGCAGLAHPQAVEAEEHRQGGMVVVVALGGEEEGAQLGAVETPARARVHLGATDVLGRIGTDPPVDMREAVEAADGGESPVDGRGGQPAFLAGGPPQLEVRPLGFEHRQSDAGAPVEVATQVEAVGLEGSTAVASQEGRPSHVSFLEWAVGRAHQHCGVPVHCGHRLPPCREEDSEHLIGAHCSRAEWDGEACRAARARMLELSRTPWRGHLQ
jgi:hypothetical protein